MPSKHDSGAGDNIPGPLDVVLLCEGTAFVREAYLAVLSREPDPSGLVTYLSKLQAGVPKLQILRELSESPEGRMRAATPLPESQAPARRLSEIDLLLSVGDDDFLPLAYELLLGRPIDAEGSGHYGARLQDGSSRKAILASIAASTEYEQRGRPVPGLQEALGQESGALRRMARRLVRRVVLGAQRQVNPPPFAPAAQSAPAMTAREPAEIQAPSTKARAAYAGRAGLLTLPTLDERAQGGPMAKHAAVTIVSKNYLAFAQTLAESYSRHHPGHDFIVVLVDKADGLVPARLAGGAEVIEVAAFRLPDLPRMIYRYSIMELNTAVKPFVMADLFEHRGYETLLYLDPDIQVFQPLAAVHSALSRCAIALTPHMRRPYFDGHSPSDTAILQSGTYNLGFLGLRRSESARRLLAWWMTKLYRDCVVDIAGGLFVDQKWIDLVPGFFPDHEIIHHPGYNAAYWNLHEREIDFHSGQWWAGGEALAFFHFSGYLPHQPQTLSKHQDRHRLDELPMLRQLTDNYAQALRDNGYETSSRWPYAFSKLPNGVELPMDLVSRAMQWCARNEVQTPCPITEPDEFCRFLMSRQTVPDAPAQGLLYSVLLELRPDVASAFPGARLDGDDPGFRAWIAASGVEEYRLRDLLPFERVGQNVDAVASLFDRLRDDGGVNWLDHFQGLWHEAGVFDAFVRWLEVDGLARTGLGAGYLARLRAASRGVHAILNLYFVRADLRHNFGNLRERVQIDAFIEWLGRNRHAHGLTLEDVSLFGEFARGSDTLLGQMCAKYGGPGAAKEAAGRASQVDGAADGALRVNLAGYLTAPTGMGESARSMRALLESTGLAVRPLTLPNEATLEDEMPPTVELFGWPWADAALSIAVANADVTARLAEFLPHGFRAKRNIGYWVWETETLPARFRHAQSAFDEIWTPSRYSAQAISATIDRPVRVLPHCVDLASIDRAHPDRARFGLPSDALLFGFAFDPMSNLERKNVLGLLRAFQSAFRHDDHCYLVLKVNSARFSSYEFDRIKGEVINDRVLFVEGVLDRISTFAFMKSLDTYVSLHRSEGFGLSCAEAMACGLPVVASRYSGNLDFMRDDNSLLVTTRVVQTDRPHGPYPAGTRWGDPDLDAAVAALRDLLADDARWHLGDAGNSSVRRELSRDRIGERLMALISSDQEPSPMAVPSDPTARWPS